MVGRVGSRQGAHRRNLGRAAAIGCVGAVALLGPAAIASAQTTDLPPIATIGHAVDGYQLSACGGYIDVRAANDREGSTPNALIFTTHFVGISPVCLVDIHVAWHNLDTDQWGTEDVALSGWDGPGAPTVAPLDTGAGRIQVDIITTTPNTNSHGQFTAN